MNAHDVDLIHQLHDIILPPPIGWWPLAEVWWFIIVGSLGLLTWFVWMLWRNWALDAYRREALSRLAQIEQAWRAHTLDNPAEAIQRVLKEVAVTAYTPEQRGNLHGPAWHQFLRRSAVRVSVPEDLDRLLALAYQPKAEPDEIERLLTFARAWIRRHHQ